MKHFSLPFVMGAAMGLMMLRMLHSAVLNEGGPAGLALVVFIGAHVLLGLVALAATIFAARISQKARKFLARLHRPSAAHMATMLAGVATSSLVAHGFIHGGLV